MNGRTYDSAKLDLADVIRSAMDLARNRKHVASAEAAQRLLAALAEDRFQLAVVGRFNGGKSSLMNAVLGRVLLPTGMRPLTSVITSVCYGSRGGIEVFFRNRSLPARGTLEQIAEYATEEGNPANGKEVASVLVRAGIDLLRNGFYFVDTPGIGSEIAANTATTERYLPEADAVIFVTSFDSPMHPEELDFLRRVRRHAGKIFYVVNKLDLVAGPERPAALEQVRKLIGNEADAETLRIFALSARGGLDAKLRADAEAVAASGFPEFEAALFQFLEGGKSREFLTRMAGRTKNLIAAERFYTRLAGVAQGQIDAFNESIHDLRRDAKAAVESASAKLRISLPGALEIELRQWTEETILLLEKDENPPGDELPAPVLRSQWDRWVEKGRRSLASLMLEIAGDEIRPILRLANRPAEIAAEAIRAESPAIPGRLDLLERVALHFTAAPETPLVSRRWWNFGEQARRHAVHRALQEYAGGVRTCTVESALDWISRLVQAAWSDCETEIANTCAAIQSDTAEADVRVLRRLDEAVDSIAGSVRQLQVESQPEGDGATEEASRNLLHCCICARVARDIYTYLSKDQYDLATSPRRQADHAEENGFCTLHSWQYESIAAPQGLCLAYAPLLQKRARELAAAAEGGVQEILQALDMASAEPKQCRICRFIAERERSIARELTVRLSASLVPAHVPLCMLHLRTLIHAGVTPEVARDLAAAESRWLERCARDMRMYALKHSAIRRELATEEERTAYSRGLARVAGERAIAFPWRADE